jgi:hypothetical protein
VQKDSRQLLKAIGKINRKDLRMVTSDEDVEKLMLSREMFFGDLALV